MLHMAAGNRGNSTVHQNEMKRQMFRWGSIKVYLISYSDRARTVDFVPHHLYWNHIRKHLLMSSMNRRNEHSKKNSFSVRIST